MILVSVDSSGKTAAAAVSRDQTLLAETFAAERLTHSQTLLPLIDAALKKAGLTIRDADCFAVTAGPGSFTGLRIGCSLVKGLAGDRLCIPVSTLEAMAFNEAESGRIAAAVLDARCRQVYLGCYAFEGGVPRQVIPDQACAAEEAAAAIRALDRPAVLVGDGAEILSDLADGERIVLSKNNAIFGRSVARAALFCRAAPAEELVPSYYRLSQAERERKQKEKREG